MNPAPIAHPSDLPAHDSDRDQRDIERDVSGDVWIYSDGDDGHIVSSYADTPRPPTADSVRYRRVRE